MGIQAVVGGRGIDQSHHLCESLVAAFSTIRSWKFNVGEPFVHCRELAIGGPAHDRTKLRSSWLSRLRREVVNHDQSRPELLRCPNMDRNFPSTGKARKSNATSGRIRDGIAVFPSFSGNFLPSPRSNAMSGSTCVSTTSALLYFRFGSMLSYLKFCPGKFLTVAKQVKRIDSGRPDASITFSPDCSFCHRDSLARRIDHAQQELPSSVPDSAADVTADLHQNRVLACLRCCTLKRWRVEPDAVARPFFVAENLRAIDPDREIVVGGAGGTRLSVASLTENSV